MSDRPLMPRGSTEHGEAPPLEASVRAIERAAGALATASVARMDETLPWFRELPADQRAWVMLVAQAGVRSLVEWLRRRGATGNGGLQESDEVLDAAPRALARSLKLEQTVQLIRITIDVVEQQVGRLAAPGEEVAIREAVLQFSRETSAVLHTVYRAARRMGVEILGGVHGDRLVVVLGGAPDPLAAAERLLVGFGDGPVVVGPAVPSLDEATESARAALAGYRAAPAWPAAPRPVAAADLLPERALAGDLEARRILRQDVYGALARSGGELLETLDAFFAAGGVLESAARALYVHPNTVRYRLRRVSELTGLAPFSGRDAFALRVALTVGRLDAATPTPPV